MIFLLKEFGVRYAVLSPGTRNIPIVHSLEQDTDFKCYSIVDERSAAYFALGLAIEIGEPVLMSCTSGTASANYTSAMWEASKQNIPLVALTSDRNQYYIDQLEDQSIYQHGMFEKAARCSVTLPIVENEKDAWYCNRLVNEALLALKHRCGGPVHINLPTEWGLFAQNFNTEILPVCRKITRYDLKETIRNIQYQAELLKSKKILIIYGQNRPVTIEETQAINIFVNNFDCVVSVETISNLLCKKMVNTNLISRALTKETFKKLVPDIVISCGHNYVSQIKGLLKSTVVDFEHWSINQDGTIVDQFKKLTKIFECGTKDFFEIWSKNISLTNNTECSYYYLWKKAIDMLPKPNFEYSSIYAMQAFLSQLPKNAIVHHGNGIAIHIAQYFPTDPSIESYCHTGTTTIDGSLSTFIGQATITNKLCFVFIGDLSFFYDMNSIWNQYVGNNVRILIYNNEGGSTFHWNSAKDIKTLPKYISAEHFCNAKAWVESRGFKYFSASNKQQLDALLPVFVSSKSDQPIVLEVFTKKERDGKLLHDYYAQCQQRLIEHFQKQQ